MATKEIIWCWRILADLEYLQEKATVLNSDSQNTIRLALSPEFHSRTKHVNIKYHMIREQIKNGVLQINYISLNDNVADIFTKPLAPEKFKKLCALLAIQPG